MLERQKSESAASRFNRPENRKASDCRPCRSEAWWKLVLHEEASWRGIGDPFVAVHRDEAGDADGYAIYRLH